MSSKDNPDTSNSNVVSLFRAKKSTEDNGKEEEEEEEERFEDVMARNAKNKERMARERANANRSVLRSYRIKS